MGTCFTLGPARSNLSNWNYETVDIALPSPREKHPASRSMELWKRPMAQMGNQRDCPVNYGADRADPVFNTDWNWQVLTGESNSSLDDFVVPGYWY